MTNPRILYIGIPLLTSIGVCQAGTVSGRSPEAEKKPNILLIISDDQSFRANDPDGNPEVLTPNLDRLKRSGTTFTHAYNMGSWQPAVCIASRAMLITGAYLWNAYELEQQYRDAENLPFPLWGNLMQEAGYETYFSGKWHVRRDAAEVFDHVLNVRPGMPRDYPEGYNRPLNENDTVWQPWDEKWGGFWEGGRHWSEVLADDALSFFAATRDTDKPFFMYLSFNAPHDPRQSPREFVDMYPLENISLPPNFQPLYPYKNEMGSPRTLRDERLAPFPRTEYSIRVNRREYYAIITHMDHQIGIILDELERTGEADNTYIFFTSDHGLAVGEHGLMGKQNMYEHSIRVPFIVCGPDIPAGKSVSADIYLQDVTASSLDIAGIEKPRYVQFNSIMDLARGSDNGSRYDAIYGAYMHLQRMIRKDGFKLIVYPEGNRTLLFDLENDPREINDLSGNPDYRHIKISLFYDLLDLQKEMDDDLDLTNVDI